MPNLRFRLATSSPSPHQQIPHHEVTPTAKPPRSTSIRGRFVSEFGWAYWANLSAEEEAVVTHILHAIRRNATMAADD
jgi:hypothetical protein